MGTPISGQQVYLCHGRYTAVIATVGASLRFLKHGGRDLVIPFDENQVRPLYRGATLAPWPNRVVDGRYSFAGTEHQLPINEVSKGHALHGLVAWQEWAVERRTVSATKLATTITPQDGYPFQLHLVMDVMLDDDGLHTTLTATNQGSIPAPYGAAPHPYLTTGVGRVDDWQLTLSAATILEVTPDRLIPTRTRPLEESPPFDFRRTRTIGAVEIDHAYTDLLRGNDDIAEVRLEMPGKGGTAIRWDASCPWVQIHTADRPEAENNRTGLAVEPMTCPPDAFNSHKDLIVLAPGANHTACWSIRVL